LNNESDYGRFYNESDHGRFYNESDYGRFYNESDHGRFYNESDYGRFYNEILLYITEIKSYINISIILKNKINIMMIIPLTNNLKDINLN
jgi:hypothetical protein